jgi:hypothetical protein
MSTLAAIRQEMMKAGYRNEAIVNNYVFSDVLEPKPATRCVGLVAFSHTPASYRSAAIAAEEMRGQDPAAVVAGYRALGAPLFLLLEDNSVTAWQVRTKDPPRLIATSQVNELPVLFAAHREEWGPLAIHRAKSIGRFDRAYQLDFVDQGLLPAIEGEIHVKLERLLDDIFAETLRARREATGTTVIDDRSMFRTTFRLLAAKVLNDRGHELASKWRSDDIDSVLDAISTYYRLPRFPQERVPEHRTVFAAAWDHLRNAINFRNISSDDLAFVYEHTLVTPETRRYFGTHSIPRQLAEYIVGHLELWQHDPSELRVYEPFAGAALFLVAALRQLRDLLPGDWTDAARHQFLSQRIAGDEVDAFASEVAKLSLILADYPNANGWEIGECDLFADQTLARRLSRANVVLCNPPFRAFSQEEKARYPEMLARSTTKSGAALNVALDSHPLALGFILPRAFIDERRFQTERRRVEALYSDIELVSLPEHTFKTSAMEASALIARSPRRGIVGGLTTLISTVVPARHRDEFLRLGEPVVSRTASGATRNPPTGNLWLRDLDALWRYLSDYPTLGSIAEIHRGIEWQGDQSKATSDEEHLGYRVGLHNAAAVHPFMLDAPVWLDVRAERLLYKAIDLPWERPKIIANAVRLTRGSWRLAAAVDNAGLICSQQLFGCWLASEQQTELQAWAAVLNGPVANAFVTVDSPAKGIRISTIRALPIPSRPPSDVEPLIAEYRTLFLPESFNLVPESTRKANELLNYIDANVLRAYDLPPRLERELLEFFRGARRPTLHPWHHWLSEDFSPAIPLHEYLSGTHAKAAGNWVLDVFAPLPINEAELLREYLAAEEQE